MNLNNGNQKGVNCKRAYKYKFSFSCIKSASPFDKRLLTPILFVSLKRALSIYVILRNPIKYF